MSSICNCTCDAPVTKTVPEYVVLRTGLCIVKFTATVGAHSAHAASSCLRQPLCTLHTTAFGG